MTFNQVFSKLKTPPPPKQIFNIQSAEDKLKRMLQNKCKIDELAEFYFLLAQDYKKIKQSSQDKQYALQLFPKEILYLIKDVTIRDLAQMFYFFHTFRLVPVDAVQDIF